MSKIVVPGEVLYTQPKFMNHSYVEGGKTHAAVMGLFDEADGRLVALQGPYIPNLEDYVVGWVEEVKFAGYTINIKSPYDGFLSSKETREEFKLGDIVLAMARSVDEVRNVNLSDARKLEGGELVTIPSVKVPRLIGKKSSMVTMVTEFTRSEIVIGKNGLVWIKGGDSALAARAVLKIDKEAHIQGLTDRMKKWLEAETGRKLEDRPAMPERETGGRAAGEAGPGYEERRKAFD